MLLVTATTSDESTEPTTRERIVQFATDVVQRSGYHALRFADLADHVGIKKASLHYHFPTKEDLGREVMSTYRQQMRDKLAAIDTLAIGPKGRLEMYVGLYRGVLNENGEHMCPGGMLAAETMSLPPELRDQMLGFFEDNENWVATVIAELWPDRSDAEHAEIARELIAALQGHLLMGRLHGEVSGLDRLWGDIERMLP